MDSGSQTGSGIFTKYYLNQSLDCLCVTVCVSVPYRWVIFNDQKVCASEKPPKDMGYLYFYRRVAE